MVGSHARFWRIPTAVSGGLLPCRGLLATFSPLTSTFPPDLGASIFFHQTLVVFFDMELLMPVIKRYAILGDSAGTSTVGPWVGVSSWGLCGHLDGGPLGRVFFAVLYSDIDLVLEFVPWWFNRLSLGTSWLSQCHV